MNKKRISLVLLGVVLGPILVGAAGAALGPGGILAAFSIVNPVATSGTTHWGADNGLDVGITGGPNLSSGNPATSSNTLEFVTSDGNITVSSTGPANITIDVITGTWTNTSGIDATTNNITVNPGDKPAFVVGGDADNVSVRDSFSLDDSVVDFVYGGASGSTTLVISGLPVNTDVIAADASSGASLGVDTTNASGYGEFSLTNSEHSVLLKSSAGGPNVTDPSPTGDLSNEPTELNVSIDDPDFPSDNVTVEMYYEGNLEKTTSITSQQYVSTSITGVTGGAHNWSVVATDELGNQAVENYSFNTPDTLYIKSETDPDSLVNNTQVNITAYSGETVFSRNTSDGTISLDGFPIDDPVIVRMKSNGYQSRTVVIESVYDQNSAYLLNNSVPSYLVRFELVDPTGEFPDSDTVLFVERALVINGSTDWETVTGDNFGVKGVPVYLEQDARYRLRIKNLETSTSAVLGSFTAIQDETVEVSPASATIDINGSEKAYGWSVTENETSQKFIVEYEDTESATQSVTVKIVERYNASNVLAANQTFTSQSFVYETAMTANQTNKTWTAVLYVDRGGDTMVFRETASSQPDSLIPVALDSVWTSAAGVFIMLVSGMAFSELNKGVGAVAVSLIGAMLWFLGVLGGVAAGAAVVVAIMISVVFHYRTGGDY